MKTSRQLILCAAFGFTSLAAHAAMPVNAADLPRISNGGTGFIGLTASAGNPRQAYMPTQAADSGVPLQAGEASTMVDGVPNRHIASGMVRSAAVEGAARDELRTMGQRGAPAAAIHPSWGTPK